MAAMGTDELKQVIEGIASGEEQLYTTELTGIHLVRAPSMQPDPVSTSMELLDLTSICCMQWDKGGSERKKQPGAHIIMNLCSKSTTYYSKIASFLGNSPGQYFARGL